MYYFISDEHYGHKNIITYSNRPFRTIEEMDETLISNHNSLVTDKDTVIHAGDFTLFHQAGKYISQLNGHHFFIRGSHDYWLKGSNVHEIWERNIDGHYIVVCHYAMRVWPRSHYNSWLLFGHSHGKLPPIGKQHDIGVDNNNFYPVSFKQIITIMNQRPDNPNFIKKRRKK